MINKYIKSSHISERQTRAILKYFSLDIETTKSPRWQESVARRSIVSWLIFVSALLFSVKKKASLNRDALSLTKATLARSESVANAVVEQAENISCLVWLNEVERIYSGCFKLFRERTYPIIVSKVSLDSTIYTNGFKTYDGLVDFSYQKHYRVQHGNNEFANGHNYILKL